jgi:hypothetical protein
VKALHPHIENINLGSFPKFLKKKKTKLIDPIVSKLKVKGMGSSGKFKLFKVIISPSVAR